MYYDVDFQDGSPGWRTIRVCYFGDSQSKQVNGKWVNNFSQFLANCGIQVVGSYIIRKVI